MRDDAQQTDDGQMIDERAPTGPSDTHAAQGSVYASAPGKVMLAGEYAVLDGAEALVAAVNRRVWAQTAGPGDEEMLRGARRSPFLRAVRHVLASEDDKRSPRSPSVRAAARMIVDSRALRSDSGIKLGLGSSAAVTVAACTCALGYDSAAPPLARIHRLAHVAHGTAQARHGARGSGADIAAVVYGGLVAVQVEHPADTPVRVRSLNQSTAAGEPILVPRQSPRPQASPPWSSVMHLVFLWTETSASTPALVAQITSWRQAHPRRYQRAIDAIADAASQWIAVLQAGSHTLGVEADKSAPASTCASDIVAAVEAGGRAIAALGHEAGVALETPIHQNITKLARMYGGAAKPTGAGAGDIALAAFPSPDTAASFRQRATEAGLSVLDLQIASQGANLGSDRRDRGDQSSTDNSPSL